MPDDPFEGAASVTFHVSEIAEWTPKMAEEIAGIKIDPTPVGWFWSIPKEYAHKYPFKSSEEIENA